MGDALLRYGRGDSNHSNCNMPVAYSCHQFKNWWQQFYAYEAVNAVIVLSSLRDMYTKQVLVQRGQKVQDGDCNAKTGTEKVWKSPLATNGKI